MRLDLNEGSSNSNNDLPWHSSFNTTKKNLGTEAVLDKVVICNSGLLLLSELFKDYVFTGKVVYGYLIEALEEFCKNPSKSEMLMLECTNQKSSIIFLNDSYSGDAIWVKDSKGYSFVKPGNKQVLRTDGNPFLSPTSAKNESTEPAIPTRTRKGT